MHKKSKGSIALIDNRKEGGTIKPEKDGNSCVCSKTDRS